MVMMRKLLIGKVIILVKYMKTNFFSKILFSLIVLFLWQTPVLARDNVTDWYIKDFQAAITVNKDASLNITEKILADCGTALNKHGIFRTLPKNYKTKDGNFVLPLKLISIQNSKGRNLNYTVTENKDTVTYQIGDKDITVSGENFYEIKYIYQNTVRAENKNFDELYWNLLGSYWDLEIDSFTAIINFPVEINKNNTEIYYYAGTLGSTNNSITDYNWTGNNTLKFFSLRPFLQGESVTVSASFPKNIISAYQLTFKDKYGYSLIELILFLLFPILVFVICFRLWKKYGQDPKFKKTITPEFEIPDNLTPAEMGGIIIKGGLYSKAVTATIIRLGYLGYLKIEKIEQKILFVSNSDFKLIRTDKIEGVDLYEAEKLILNKLFEFSNEVTLSELKTTFYLNLPEISSAILNDLSSRDLVGKKGAIYGKVMLAVSAFVAFLFPFAFKSIPAFVSGILAALIILIFSFLMDKLTPKGAEINWRIKGFKLYMNTAEKYRSRFQEEEGALEKLLPYAILFGITKKWLNKMKDIYGESYFTSYHPVFMIGAFNLNSFNDFASNIESLSASMAASVSPSSSGAGGSGGAGGGGGGGGGGGW